MGRRETLSSRWKPLLLVLGVFAALALPAAGDAETIEEKQVEMTKPFPVTAPNPCTGEPVTLTGQQHMLLHIREDSSGGVHVTFALDTHGSGISLTFQRYSVSDRQFQEANLVGAQELTFDFRMRVTRAGETGSPDDFFMRTHAHMTFNSNGDPTSAFLTETFECDGEPFVP